MCSGCCAFCLSYDACSARCCLMGSKLVSSCRCCVLAYRVHSVVIRSSVFFTNSGWFVFVSDIIDQIVFPYSSVLPVIVYVLSSVSLDFSQFVVVRSFSIFVVFFTLSCLYIF